MQPDTQLEHYQALLMQWQKTINLVSPSTLNDVWNRHFADSLQLVDKIPNTVKSICDIGSGAGFPGLVIAMKRPDLHVHLIESDTRKCAFLRTVSRETKTENVHIHNDRIENIIATIDADFLTSRALASLRQIMRYSEALWQNKSDFQLLLLKGATVQNEIDEALRHYDFDYQTFPSCTDSKGKILTVNNIRTR